MVLFIPALLMLVVGIFMFCTGRRARYDWSIRTIIGNVLQITGGCLLLATLLVNLIIYVQSLNAVNSIKQYEQNAQVYTAKANTLTAQFRGYLAVQYPKYEKQIYSTFTHSPKLLFAAFPQLQASTTLVALTQDIDQLQSAVYDQQLKVNNAERVIRVNKHNALVLTFLLPS